MSNVLAFPSRPEPEPEPSGDDAPFTGPAPVIDLDRAAYTVDEAAYLLNLSRGVTYQYVREGVIPAQRIGRRWVISRRSFHAWLDGLGDTDNGGK